VTVVKSITVLLHEENQDMQKDEDHLRPLPVTVEAPRENCTQEEGLPEVLKYPSRSFPVKVTLGHQTLEDQAKDCTSDHDPIRDGKNNKVLGHYVPDLISS